MPDVILPVLNEAQAIPWVLSRMPAGYSPVIVDNGSTDRSSAIAAGLGAAVVHAPARGFGAACFAGLSAATSDVVCFMDCDGSLDPRWLPSVTDEVIAGRADLVLGRRVAEPGAWPFHARVANRVLAAKIRRRSGLPLRDLGPMRAARRDALLSLGLQDRRYGWPLEMVVRALDQGWRVVEVPVAYRARAGGRSKVTGTLSGTVRATRDMAKVLR